MKNTPLEHEPTEISNGDTVFASCTALYSQVKSSCL